MNIYQEGVLATIKRASIEKKLRKKDIELSTVKNIEDLSKFLPKAREDFRLILSDITDIVDDLKRKNPDWDGKFLTPLDKESAKSSEEKEADTSDSEEDAQSESFVLEDRKTQSTVKKVRLPDNFWYVYFFSEKSKVDALIKNLRDSRIKKSIDDYFPKKERKSLDYHRLLLSDHATIKKRGTDLLDNTGRLIELHGELSGDEYRQTRPVIFAWAFRSFESWPRYENVLLKLINRFTN